MRFRVRNVLAATLIVVASLPMVMAGQASPAAKLFQEGLMLEQAEGKVADAIFRFERVIAEFPKDREVVPKALYHLGVAYQKQQNPRALLMFSRLTAEFPAAAPADTRTRLAALQQAEGGGFRSRTLGFLSAPSPGPFGESHPIPSPDGRYVAYVKPIKTMGASPVDAGMGSEFMEVLGEMLVPTRLVLYDFTTGKEQVLVPQPGVFGNIQWSPDSRRMAFSWGETPKDIAEILTGGPDKLQIVTVATKKVQTLAIVAQALSWSPDGLRIATRDSGKPGDLTEIRITTVATNQSRSLGSTDGPPEFAWSPDRTRLAYHVTDKSKSLDEVRILTLATEHVRTLAVPPATPNTRSQIGSTFYNKWTTRNELVYRIELPKVGGDIYLVPVDGGAPRKVCEARAANLTGAGCGNMTADGSGIFRFDQATKRMLWLDVATGTNQRVTISSGEESGRYVSPDLKLVTFTANRDGRWGLYVAPLDRGPVANPVRIAVLDAQPTSFLGQGWGTNGRLVLGFGFVRSDVYRLDMDRQTGRAASVPDRLTQDAMDNSTAAMSPDGSRIAYWYRSGNKQGIAVMDTSGVNERPLIDHALPGPLAARQLAWISADEVIFLEVAPKEGQRAGLVAVNVRTGLPRTLPHGGIAASQWTYVAARNEVLYLPTPPKPPPGGNAQLIDATPITARSLVDGMERIITIPTTYVSAFAVSPDGRRIAYSTVNNDALDALEKSLPGGLPDQPKPEDLPVFMAILEKTVPAELHVAAIDGTGDQIVARANMKLMAAMEDGGLLPLAFSPDGRRVLYRASDSNTFRVIGVDGGESWPLLDKNQTDQGVTWSDATWASDGSILLKGGSNRTEFKAWDGVTHAAIVKLLGAAPRK